jgi:hypothetical protein
MKPQTTITRPATIDPRFLHTTGRFPRIDQSGIKPAHIDRAQAAQPPVSPAERARQDSLAFLHALVMG